MAATTAEEKSPDWLTPEEATTHLPFGNADWIREQLRTGKLHGSKVRGRWLTTVEAINDMVNAGSNNTRRRRQRAS